MPCIVSKVQEFQLMVFYQMDFHLKKGPDKDAHHHYYYLSL